MTPEQKLAYGRYVKKELCYFLGKLGLQSARLVAADVIYIDDGNGGLIVAQPGMNAKVFNVGST